MELRSYERTKKMPEKYLSSLIDAQIECWWSKPFDEYMICTDNDCRALHSIEEIHGSIANFRQKLEKNINCNCAECWSELETYYKKNKFFEEAKKYFKWEVHTVLLLEDEKVEGFAITSRTNIDSLVEVELNTRVWSYDKEYISKKLNKISKTEYINCLHHIFVSKVNRNKWYSNLLHNEMFNFLWEKSNCTVLETRYDSTWYLFAKAMWFIEISKDKHWYILMFLENRNFFKQDYKNIIKKIQNYFLLNNHEENYFLNKDSLLINNRKQYI